VTPPPGPPTLIGAFVRKSPDRDALMNRSGHGKAGAGGARSHDAEAAPLLGELSQLCSRNLEEAQLLWKHLLMNREG